MSPRLLVIEGNTAELRAEQVAAGGQVMSDGYADLLRRLLPQAVVQHIERLTIAGDDLRGSAAGDVAHRERRLG